MQGDFGSPWKNPAGIQLDRCIKYSLEEYLTFLKFYEITFSNRKLRGQLVHIHSIKFTFPLKQSGHMQTAYWE